jgi:hypothetical protein
MGTAFSRGDGDHLPPMRVERSLFVTETQADQLRPELTVEVMDFEEAVWVADPEAGMVRVDPPEQGKMVRVKVTGQAVVFVGENGKLMIDNRGY